jgi:hypothetical protein
VEAQVWHDSRSLLWGCFLRFFVLFFSRLLSAAGVLSLLLLLLLRAEASGTCRSS